MTGADRLLRRERSSSFELENPLEDVSESDVGALVYDESCWCLCDFLPTSYAPSGVSIDAAVGDPRVVGDRCVHFLISLFGDLRHLPAHLANDPLCQFGHPMGQFRVLSPLPIFFDAQYHAFALTQLSLPTKFGDSICFSGASSFSGPRRIDLVRFGLPQDAPHSL